MVAHERGWVQECKKPDDNERKWSAEMVDGLGKGNILTLHVQKYLCEARGNEVRRQNRGRSDKGEKVTIVALADAVVEPHAVVVVAFDAVVAKATVVGTRGSPDVAGPAVLDRNFHGRRTGLG